MTSPGMEPLPVDTEAEQVISDYAALREGGAEDIIPPSDPRVRFAIGRRLLHVRRRIAALQAEQAAVDSEYQRAIALLVAQAVAAEQIMEAYALEHRRAGNGNVLDVPGIGRWSMRAKPERWEIDNDKVILTLAGDDRRFVESRPQPDKDYLLGPAFREHLDTIVGEAVAELVAAAGFDALEEDEQRRRIEAVKAGIAAQYTGVVHVPAVIGVTSDLNL